VLQNILFLNNHRSKQKNICISAIGAFLLPIFFVLRLFMPAWFSPTLMNNGSSLPKWLMNIIISI